MPRKKKTEEATALVDEDNTPPIPKVQKKGRKKKEETLPVNALDLKFEQFVNRKLEDMGTDEEGYLVLYFDNGAHIKVKGNVFVTKGIT